MSRKKGIEIKPSEHVFVCGRTGSGKTVLARVYLAGMDHVVCLDTKGTLKWPEVPKNDLALVTRMEDLPKVTEPKIIYRPRFEELIPEYYEQFFKWVYLRGNNICWVDEAFSVSPNPYKLPTYYRAIMTRGRELNVGCWSLTQRPSGIAQVIVSENIHYFTFDMNLIQDRKKLVDITGQEEMIQRPGKYNFWYYHVDNDTTRKAKLKLK